MVVGGKCLGIAAHADLPIGCRPCRWGVCGAAFGRDPSLLSPASRGPTRESHVPHLVGAVVFFLLPSDPPVSVNVWVCGYNLSSAVSRFCL